MAEYAEKTNNYNTVVNGKILYYSFLAGANQLLQHQAEINKINVFPVNDKDTGTNLAATARSVLDNVKPHKSYKTTVNEIVEAALVGARGNSGVILLSFYMGCVVKQKTKPESISPNLPKRLPFNSLYLRGGFESCRRHYADGH